jgi:two-component system response regulator
VERGARNVTLQSIEKLALALEISVSKLLSYPRAATGSSGAGQGFEPDELVDILYVEDSPADVGLAKQGLKSIANHIFVVPDGIAALNFLFGAGEHAHRLTSQRPQLILLDLGLPKMDGLEVLRRIKGDARTSSIPVIVLTASLRDRDLQMSKQLGAEAYIVKPLSLQNLSLVTSQLQLHWALVKRTGPVRAMPAARG